MHKPRLVVRLAVALLAFAIGIASTLLVNYLWPRTQPQTSVRYELRVEPQTRPAPHTHGPCGDLYGGPRPAFVWTPAAPPPPPAPPAPPRVKRAGS
jgi:hypothetical protein